MSTPFYWSARRSLVRLDRMPIGCHALGGCNIHATRIPSRYLIARRSSRSHSNNWSETSPLLFFFFFSSYKYIYTLFFLYCSVYTILCVCCWILDDCNGRDCLFVRESVTGDFNISSLLFFFSLVELESCDSV